MVKNLKIIHSVRNEKIRTYVKLSSNSREREKTGLFTFEGVKLAKEAASSVEVVSVFVTRECLENYREPLAEVLERCDDVCLINQIGADKLTVNKQPQGVFVIACKGIVCDNNGGIAEKLVSAQNTKSASGRNIYVLLNEIADPGNLGTIIRGADAFGLDGVILSAGCCDVYNYKAIRASMGSVFRMPIYAEKDIPSFLKKMAEAKINTYAAVVDKNPPAAGSEAAEDYKFTPPCILCLGSEADGLPERITSLCSRRVTIGMKGKAQSLNAAAAAHILMWRMSNGLLYATD